jgi:hypothetical protein
MDRESLIANCLKKIKEHDDMEERVRKCKNLLYVIIVRFTSRDLNRDYDKTEDNLKAL